MKIVTNRWSEKGFSMIELVLGLTLLVIVLGLGYKAVLSINRQQTSASNKAARLNIANSVKNSALDYLGTMLSTNIQRFDDPSTVNNYWLAYTPGEDTNNQHLRLIDNIVDANNPQASMYNRGKTLADISSVAQAAYNSSKYKVEVTIGDAQPPIYDRRLTVTVLNTDQGKGGGGHTESETFEYFLSRPRTSVNGGQVILHILNAMPSGSDPDGVPAGGPVGRIQGVLTPVNDKENPIYARSSSADGLLIFHGVPFDTDFTLQVMGNMRGKDPLGQGYLVPYYLRNCNPQDASNPASIWTSRSEKIGVYVSGGQIYYEDSTIASPHTQKILSSHPNNDLGTVWLWPYARVTGLTTDANNGSAVDNIGVALKPIHTEDPNAIAQETQSKNGGKYSMNVAPGFWYRAVFGTVERNTDPTYPAYTQRTSGSTSYAGLVMPNEINAVVHKALANPQASDYPFCILVRPGENYGSGLLGDTATQTPLNTPKATNLQVKPMGDLKFTLKVAKADGSGTYQIDGDQSALNNTFISLFAYKRLKTVYPFSFADTTYPWGTPDPNRAGYLDGLGTYLGAFAGAGRIKSSLNWYMNLGVGDLADKNAFYQAGTMLSAWGSAGTTGSFPNFCVPFDNIFYPGDQFAHRSYPVVFPSFWGDPLSPIMILTEPGTNRQLYAFYLGGQKYFTMNPNPDVFHDVVSGGDVVDYAIDPVETGINTDGRGSYGWFKEALSCDHTSSKIQDYRVLPRSALATIKGKLITPARATWYPPPSATALGISANQPEIITSWTVDYSGPGGTGVVNFAHLSTSEIDRTADTNTYEVHDVIPSIMPIGNVSYGNGRALKAQLFIPLPASGPYDFLNLVNYYQKAVSATGYTPQLINPPFASAISNTKLQITDGGQGQRATAFISLLGNTGTEQVEGINGGYSIPAGEAQAVYTGRSKAVLIKPGTAAAPAVVADAPGPGVTQVEPGVDIVMPDNANDEKNPTYYVRADPNYTSTEFVDSNSPAGANILGIPTQFCGGAAPAAQCGRYHGYSGGAFYGLQGTLSFYRILKPLFAIIVVSDEHGLVDGAKVTLYTSSLKKFRQTGDQWQPRVTATTDNGMIVLSNLTLGQNDPVTDCYDLNGNSMGCAGLSWQLTTFVGFQDGDLKAALAPGEAQRLGKAEPPAAIANAGVATPTTTSNICSNGAVLGIHLVPATASTAPAAPHEGL